MFILQAKNIKKEYGGRTILDFEELTINKGDHIGIVGKNGAGKSTLLGILMGEIQPDYGTVDCKYNRMYLRQFDKSDTSLSGGENMKKRILDNMNYENQILFADEPTANLDKNGVEWVTDKLAGAETVVIVSHDRALLNELCTQIISVDDGKLKYYTGNYDQYHNELDNKNQLMEKKNQDYNNKKHKLEQAIEAKVKKVERGAQSYKKALKNNSSEAILGKNRLSVGQKKLEKEVVVLKDRIGRLEPGERIAKAHKMYMDFSLTDPPGNKRVIASNDFTFSYDNKEIFKNASFEILNGERVAFIGNNGAGKTTLLREIYNKNLSITCAPKLKFGYLKQDFSQLNDNDTVLENVMATSVQTQETARNMLAGLLFFGNDVFKPAKVLSGGEKIRLSLGKLLLSDINGLILDEPTNYLDISSMEALQNILLEYKGTILLVSHDETFRKTIATKELIIENKKIISKAKETKKAVKPDRVVLDMKRIRLISEIESAAADEKIRLEKEYQEVINLLSEIKKL